MPLVYSYNSNKGRKEKNDDAVSVSKNKHCLLYTSDAADE